MQAASEFNIFKRGHQFISSTRSLWNMYNYIHIMLCGNLFIAQLLFVIGADKTSNEVHVYNIIVLLYIICSFLFIRKCVRA